MATHNHAVVWIDHHEAHVIFFNADDIDSQMIHAPNSPWHIHSKAGSPSGTHLHGDDVFFQNVAEALKPAHEILVAGPSEAKGEFAKFIEKHAHDVQQHVTGVKTLQRVTDKQLVADARRYFKSADRLAPQIATLPTSRGAN